MRENERLHSTSALREKIVAYSFLQLHQGAEALSKQKALIESPSQQTEQSTAIV